MSGVGTIIYIEDMPTEKGGKSVAKTWNFGDFYLSSFPPWFFFTAVKLWTFGKSVDPDIWMTIKDY
jgi:hypothetical protein